MKKGRKVGHLFAFIAVFAAIVALVMGLWNALIPAIMGWSTINYWQAAGLMVLCRLLFRGFGGFRHPHHSHRHGRHWGNHFFGDHARFHEKMKQVPPEERRDYLRRRMRDMHEHPHYPCGEEKNTHEQ